MTGHLAYASLYFGGQRLEVRDFRVDAPALEIVKVISRPAPVDCIVECGEAPDLGALFSVTRRPLPVNLAINGKPLPVPYRVVGHRETAMGLQVDMAPAFHCHKCTGWGAVRTRRHHRMCSRRGE